MKVFSILFFLFLYQLSFAANDMWLCKEESSQREGSSIYSCGVGTGMDENIARMSAFDNSKSEFTRICSASDDCKGHEIFIEPKRTSCEQKNGSYKCYRLIVFNIQKNKIEPSQDQNTNNYKNGRINIEDKPDKFESFYFESIANNPRVHKSMSKKELLAAFGAPYTIIEHSNYNGTSNFQMIYRGNMCVQKICYVIVDRNKVTSYTDFKPIYTDDLR